MDLSSVLEEAAFVQVRDAKEFDVAVAPCENAQCALEAKSK